MAEGKFVAETRLDRKNPLHMKMVISRQTSLHLKTITSTVCTQTSSIMTMWESPAHIIVSWKCACRLQTLLTTFLTDNKPLAFLVS
jgi:hypothetical protein